MKEAVIREIAAEDNMAIARVIRQVLLEMGMPKVGTAYADKSLDAMFENYDNTRHRYFIVEDDHKIVGGAGIAPLDNCEDNICELQKMYFLPEARGKGLGKLMLERCIDAASEFKFDKIYLETMPYMQNATKLYQKFGFIPLDKPLGDTGHHACQVWMTKAL